jgi:hypothetical protein
LLIKPCELLRTLRLIINKDLIRNTKVSHKSYYKFIRLLL